MSITNNVILLTDSYKVSHSVQYPEGTTEVYSYFESRGGQFDEITFVGLQYFLEEYLSKPITQEDIEEAAEDYALHFGNEKLFNREGWEYILKQHGGYLPVSIKAVPEGLTVGTKNVLMTVVNTDPKCFWLTNYLETLLSQVWYPSTVASLSRQQKKYIKAALDKSADNSDGLMFKLHDFGFRGATTVESAGIGGFAHLVNFMGTDTVPALRVARKYYSCRMAGFSIPASEHSTITSWGKENEVKAMANMLDKYPTGLVACVSDSYNIYKACEEYWGTELKDKILNRDGCLVVRPDSGEPTEVVPKILQILYEKLGGTVNSKGYKMLPPQVRVIQGDGIDVDTLPKLLDAIMKAGFSTDNLAFGSGGGLLQKVNRDTSKFAFKCCSVVVAGEQRDVYKQPIDTPWKISKKGKLKLVLDHSWKDKKIGPEYTTVGLDDLRPDELVEVYRNGKVLVKATLDDLRNRAGLK
jgi:nicotinamide phosphoribosyltransferase